MAATGNTVGYLLLTFKRIYKKCLRLLIAFSDKQSQAFHLNNSGKVMNHQAVA